MKNYFNILSGSVGKFPFLDGLRAIAILLVLARHILHYWPWDLEFETKLNIFYIIGINGWLGVDLFFVLSGFLITYHLVDKWPRINQERFIKKYFIKRFLRIIPLYLAIIILVKYNIIPYYSAAQKVDDSLIAIHLLFLQDYFYSPIVVPLWSLATEEKFYLIAPLFCFIHKYKPKWALFSICAIFILITIINLNQLTQNYPKDYSSFFWNNRAPFHIAVRGLLTGTFIALSYILINSKKTWFKEINIFYLRTLSYSSFLALAVILINSDYINKSNWIEADIANVSFGICSASFIFAGLFVNTKLNMLLSSKFLRIIAILSYSLYITHITIIPLSIHLVNKFEFSFLNKDLCLFFIYLIISCLFSLTLHYLVEKPFLILKSKIK